ncbi:MAG: hypothetical protein M1833_001974 [Piccolia ochrophora]|nr:MAG: hypothetical protein M1833_001974 [Piccolia ochrophora]
MRSNSLLIRGLLVTVLGGALATSSADSVEDIQAQAISKRKAFDAEQRPESKCNLSNAPVRREWSSLTLLERREYIDALNCLMEKPPITPPSEASGVRSRYDDLVATHINQTLAIHGTANFLGWHRYFTWTLEKALREECGYKGYQPYWNWGKYAADPLHAPMFDGSENSLSGNGESVPHNRTQATPFTTLLPGPGGGCVRTGPFANMSVNLGPKAPTLDRVEAQTGNGLDYNPRCLRRDISAEASNGWTKTSDIVSLITQSKEIYWFQTIMQGEFQKGFLGVHTGGHFTIGGDPGGDLYVSPGDPAFWIHHGMIDRVWWIWQNLEPETRLQAISGTITISNRPPSRNGTLEDLTDLGVNAPPVPLGQLLDTMSGPFCYTYE